MSKLTPKPIVDKNGKSTTVHVKAENTDTSASRVAAVSPAPPATEEEEWTPPERISYEQMKERAAAIHPDAKLSLSHGEWVVTIETGVYESHELPERFRGTPAWDKFHESNNGESGLHEWVDNGGGVRDAPNEVNAEYYNLNYESHVLRRIWYDGKMKEIGGRTYEQILRLEPGAATEEEKAVIRDYLGDKGEAALFVKETLADRYQVLFDTGF